jgi:hypothetical protein
MSTAPNPLAAIMARQMMAKLAPQGGGQPGQPQTPGGDNPDQAGQQIQTQLAELQGADPSSLLKVCKQIKSQLVAIYPRCAFSVPDAASKIAQSQKYLDSAIKDFEKAAEVASTVQSPIANNAGQPPQGQQGGLEQFAQGAQ